jgi:hypothetical protein
MTRWLLTLVALGICLSLPQPVLGQVKLVKEGKRHARTTAEDWQRHPNKGKYFTESWTVAARSGQGHIMYLNFLYSNIGVFAGSAAVNLTFRKPGKEGKHYVFEYPQAQWGEDPKTGRIGVGASWMAFNGKKAEVRVKEKTVKMALTLQSWTRGAKLYGGKYTVGGDHWVQVFNPIPRATISGQVTIDGETFDFAGDAFVDHWVQTLLATDYCNRMYTVRFFDDEFTVALLMQTPRASVGGDRIVQAMVTDRTGIRSFGGPLKLTGKDEVKDPRGHRYATTYEVEYGKVGGPVHLKGTFGGGKLWDRDAILDQLSAAQKQVVKWVAGNPVVYRLEGQGDLILTLDGQEHHLSGPALMESIVLGGK